MESRVVVFYVAKIDSFGEIQRVAVDRKNNTEATHPPFGWMYPKTS